MSYLIVAKPRDDGDFDVIAAFQNDNLELDLAPMEWALQIGEYIDELSDNAESCHAVENYKIFYLAEMSDVLSASILDENPNCDVTKRIQDQFASGDANYFGG